VVAELESLQQSELGDERHNYYRFLYLLALHLRPPTMLEIGVELGLGSAHMSVAAMEFGGHVIGIDQFGHDRPKKELPAKYGNYDFVEGLSTDSVTWAKVSDLVNHYGDIGLVFQDASHHYLKSKQEWGICQRFLCQGGVWVCDDIAPIFHDPKVDPPGKSMVEYWNELPVPPDRKRLYEDVLHWGNTIGVMLL
jgi:predicted O-methyltransferase YrrM